MTRCIAILLTILALCPSARAEAPCRVFTTLFPIENFARTIGGAEVEILPLLPPGSDAHTFAPTPSDMMRIAKADALLYASPEMEVWIHAFESVLPKEKIIPVVPPLPISEQEHAAHDGHDHGETDPHTWLDPVTARQIVQNITEALCTADQHRHDALFRSRAAALDAKLAALHQQYTHALAPFKEAVLISGGHFAFGPLAARYDLHPVSPYSGFSTDAQPSPRAIAALVKRIRETNAKAIFYEDTLNPKLARVLAAETGIPLLPLSSMHTRPAAWTPDAPDYFRIMEQNLHSLTNGLRAPVTP